jgi:hypothetical protein
MAGIAGERFVAVDNVCAWPNLTRMPDGAIVATIFNQPVHLAWPGNVECWASTDEGRLWTLRGTPAVHEPDTARGNVAAGLAHDGSLIVLVSGWSYKVKPVVGQRNPLDKVLDPWVCRSTDGGRSWTRAGSIVVPPDIAPVIPFGDIERSPDGTLGVSGYTHTVDTNTAHFFRSRDDGHTWAESTVIGPDDYNETDLLCLDEDRWLAASRTKKDGHLDLFVSQDGGSSWKCQEPLTEPRQHPGHLMRLEDGRILLVYGLRNQGLYGVGARMSTDGGTTWGAPAVLVDLEDARDVGYPASVQAPDGTIITAYYCNGIPTHRRYHMGVIRWRAE